MFANLLNVQLINKEFFRVANNLLVKQRKNVPTAFSLNQTVFELFDFEHLPAGDIFTRKCSARFWEAPVMCRPRYVMEFSFQLVGK